MSIPEPGRPCRGIRFSLRCVLKVCYRRDEERRDLEIDNAPRGTFCRGVNRFRRISAFLLLAVWLAATQHCVLEAAGVWGAEGDEPASACCPDSSSHCEHDACEVVEGGSIVSATSSVKVPSPEWQVCWFIAELDRIALRVSTVSDYDEVEERGRSLDWVPIWHLERRAALPPGAPSLSVA